MTSSVSASDITKGRKLTPMLQQYVDAKAEVPADAILMFRMGDFYEMFFDDARVAARELDIVLTSRDKNGGADAIPMAGVPHHAVGSYLSRLIEKGYSVALCDQIEDPKKAKGIVKRAIVRVVTPGTVADLDSLDPVNANYLAYAERVGDYWVVALMDLLAGEVLLTRAQGATLGDELRRMSVREVLCEGSTQNTLEKELGERPISLRTVDGEAPGDKKAREFLLQRFGTDQIEGLTESEASAERSALQRLLSFADNTQRRSLTHLMAPRVYHLNDHLILDEATRRNLELVQTQLNSERKGSLLWHLDRCKTAMGSRTLAQWLLFPLRDKRAISERLDAVEDLRLHRAKREAAQAALVGVRDIERLLGKVALERATPKDLALLRASLREIPKLKEELAKGETHLALAWLKIDPAREILALLEKALVEEPPLSAADGGIFNLGYDSELDEYIHLSTEGHDFLADLERRERVRTKIPTLKVRFNRVFGYYLEVSRAHSNNVPPDYIRKQTLVNAERFITDELKSYEDRVLGADERRKAKEAELFALLVKTIGESSSLLRNIGRLIARSDILAALAQVADEYNYCRPLLVDEPMISIRAGRHAVLERLMP
ncbi:DNA mismatch repair protein MutS, partial [Myxococcota bacterium]|nr:DNA mismatch repair protein MutS [Myxococcota bacterium]